MKSFIFSLSQSLFPSKKLSSREKNQPKVLFFFLCYPRKRKKRTHMRMTYEANHMRFCIYPSLLFSFFLKKKKRGDTPEKRTTFFPQESKRENKKQEKYTYKLGPRLLFSHFSLYISHFHIYINIY